MIRSERRKHRLRRGSLWTTLVQRSTLLLLRLPEVLTISLPVLIEGSRVYRVTTRVCQLEVHRAELLLWLEGLVVRRASELGQ